MSCTQLKYRSGLYFTKIQEQKKVRHSSLSLICNQLARESQELDIFEGRDKFSALKVVSPFCKLCTLPRILFLK